VTLVDDTQGALLAAQAYPDGPVSRASHRMDVFALWDYTVVSRVEPRQVEGHIHTGFYFIRVKRVNPLQGLQFACDDV
jgi:hypothetical protein